MKKIEIRCVLKSGGSYDQDYVYRLKKACKLNTDVPFDFVCLTDDLSVDFCETIPLKHNWPGWWSKIELFRPDLSKAPSVFFDLDTIIKGNIDDLLLLSTKAPFLALKGFNQRFRPPNGVNFASGLMTGSFYKYSKVYEQFKIDPETHMNDSHFDWRHGDQGFIGKTIGFDKVKRIQDFLPDNYIVGKKKLKDDPDCLDGAPVVTWSGKPRLHTLVNESDKLSNSLDKYWRYFG